MKQEFDFLLFGATGDLAMRKLFPALFDAYCAGRLSEGFSIIATGRSKLSREQFLDRLLASNYLPKSNLFPDFAAHIKYESVDISNIEDFCKLNRARSKGRDLLVYFSISPEYFIRCCKNLAQLGMNEANTRVVLEKPLGLNLAESNEINQAVLQYFKEEQIYRIDHYLGKQMVQELLNLRKNNEYLNEFLSAKNLKQIDLYVYERLGVEQRGEFYDSCGAMRDMLQNHMLQMLALFAIDAHSSDIRAAKAEFFKSLDSKLFCQSAYRAQYTAAGASAGYLAEPNVSPASRTETYISAQTTSSQLPGVMINLHTGKRMPINKVWLKALRKDGASCQIEIQPEPKVSLSLNIAGKMQTISYAGDVENMPPYERLILDFIEQKNEKFTEQAELQAAWEFVQPLLDMPDLRMHNYAAFSQPKALGNLETRSESGGINEIISALNEAIIQRGVAHLYVSGGRSPIDLFCQLSRADITWSKVCVHLVDERLVPLTHEASNSALVRKYLLQNKAAEARFIAHTDASSNEAIKAEFNANYARADVMILGMGLDAHTASIFPHASNLAQLLEAKTPRYELVENEDFMRISLNMAAIKEARKLFLYISGEQKLNLCSLAASAICKQLPISYALEGCEVIYKEEKC